MAEQMSSTEAQVSRRAFVGVAAAGAASALAGLAGCAGTQAFAAESAGTTWASATTTRTASTTTRALEPYADPCVKYASERESDPRRVLIVVDYQNDFCDGEPFGRIDTAIAIEDALYDRIKEYQDAGDIVIYTQDTHPADDYANTREGQFNPPHCDPATKGWQIYGRVAELLTPERALLVKKGTYGSRDLPFVIQNIIDQGVFVQSIELAGVSTTCRVLHNAIIVYNFFPTIPLIFDERTTASYSDEQTAEQLDELEGWGFIIKRAS